MASKGSHPKFFHEPWAVTRSKEWEGEFQFGPPKLPDATEDERKAAAALWEESRKSAEQAAPMIVWGSRMGDPTVCVGMSGAVTVMDDRRIIALSKSLTWPARGVSHVEMAHRIASCVNACASIGDPEKFVKDVRTLLLGYARGECDEDPRFDTRVISLLGRCIPPEELEQFADESTHEP